jgi:hypothetical protein
MKKLSIFLLLAILTACAGSEPRTFYFDSNVSNVVVDGRCIAPCRLELDDDYLDSYIGITVQVDTYEYSQRIDYSISFDKASFDIKPLGNPIFDEASNYLVHGSPAGVPISTTSSTTGIIMYPTFLVIDGVASTAAMLDNTAIINYAANSYYIYVSESDSYIFADPDFLISHNALTNFEQMRAELFATKRPFIDALTELTDVPNIAGLLHASEDAVGFLDSLIREMHMEREDMELEAMEHLLPGNINPMLHNIKNGSASFQEDMEQSRAKLMWPYKEYPLGTNHLSQPEKEFPSKLDAIKEYSEELLPDLLNGKSLIDMINRRFDLNTNLAKMILGDIYLMNRVPQEYSPKSMDEFIKHHPPQMSCDFDCTALDLLSINQNYFDISVTPLPVSKILQEAYSVSAQQGNAVKQQLISLISSSYVYEQSASAAFAILLVLDEIETEANSAIFQEYREQVLSNINHLRTLYIEQLMRSELWEMFLDTTL